MERTHLPAEARQNNLERYTGICGNITWLVAWGYSVFLPFKLGTLYFYTGFSVFIIGLALLAMSTFNFVTTAADQMITKGIYNFSRHPMYLSTFFICLGSGIATASWLFIFLSVVMSLCLYQEALIEERYCLKRYGTAYQEYLDRTPRWLGLHGKGNK
jgi:protein-S-isoprenylcysteine O-methyltransferase Ste14